MTRFKMDLTLLCESLAQFIAALDAFAVRTTNGLRIPSTPAAMALCAKWTPVYWGALRSQLAMFHAKGSYVPTRLEGSDLTFATVGPRGPIDSALVACIASIMDVVNPPSPVPLERRRGPELLYHQYIRNDIISERAREQLECAAKGLDLVIKSFRSRSRSARKGKVEGGTTGRRCGRPRVDETGSDERIAGAWDVGSYRTEAELARALGLTAQAVHKARDRARKARIKARRKSS